MRIRLQYLALFLVLLVSSSGVYSLRTAFAMPAARATTTIYSENFSSYANKNFVQNADWDIWNHSLQTSRLDLLGQTSPDIVLLPNGDFMAIYCESDPTPYSIHVMRIDSNGNRLWQSPVTLTTSLGDPSAPRAAVDQLGYVYIVWGEWNPDRSAIYAQRIDGDGNLLWPGPMQVNKGEAPVANTPVITIDSSNRAVIAWADQRAGITNIYAQKLGLSGLPVWATDVLVNQSPTNMPPWQSINTVIRADSVGNTVVAWLNLPTSASSSFLISKIRKLNSAGVPQWATDVTVGGGDVGWIGHVPIQDIDVDPNGNTWVAWAIVNQIYVQKFSPNGQPLWVNPVVIPAPNYGRALEEVSARLTPSGSLVVAWATNSIWAQVVKPDSTLQYPTEQQINTVARNAQYHQPRIAIGLDGQAMIAWYNEIVLNSGSYDVWVRKFNPSGGPPFPVPLESIVSVQDGMVTSDFALTTAITQGMYVAWRDQRFNDWSVFLNLVDGNGASLWQNPVLITPLGSYIGIDLAASPNGDAIVGAVDSGGAVLIQVVDRLGNKVRSTQVTLIGRQAYRILTDLQGNIFLVWSDDSSNLYARKYTSDLNLTWHKMINNIAGRTMPNNGTSIAATIDSAGNLIAAWQDWRNYSSESMQSDIYAQKLDPAGNRLWNGNDIRLSTLHLYHNGYVNVITDSSNAVYVSWHSSDEYLYLQRMDPNGLKSWANDLTIEKYGEENDLQVIANQVYMLYEVGSSTPKIQIHTFDSQGNPVWSGPTTIRQNWTSSLALTVWNGNLYPIWVMNKQIYNQEVNSNGILLYGNIHLATPGVQYQRSGWAESLTVDTVPDPITQATLTANYQLNGGSLQFYLSNNGGVNWTAVTPGIAQVFTTSGSDLRWKVQLNTDPIWPRTPVVSSLRIEYSSQPANSDAYEPDDACSQARPIALNGAVQSHNFHRADDADWVWLDVIQGKTYVIQTSQTEANADTSFSSYRDCAQVAFGSGENPYEHGARFTFTATYTGRVYIEVRNQTPPATNEFTGYAISTRLASSAPVVVIVAGHMDNLALQTNIDHSADLAYRTFVNSGVPKANIRYFGLNPARDVDHNGLNDDIAGLPEPAAIRTAIQNWAPSRGVSLGIPFFLYMVDHGYYDQFLANGTPGKITASDLDLWLSNLEATSGADQINVIIEACHSGSFIDQTSQGPGDISGHNRVVITSTASDLNAFPSLEGAFFSDAFWPALGANIDLMTAFERAKQAVQASGLSQQPWLDDNGDGIANALDGALARSRGLSAAFGSSAPVIDWIKVASKPQASGVLQAQVRDDFGVARVWVQIFEPGFVEPPPSTDATIPALNAPVLDLVADGPQSFRKSYAFNKIGLYRLVFYAKDSEDNVASPRVIFIQTGKPVFVPVIKK